MEWTCNKFTDDVSTCINYFFSGRQFLIRLVVGPFAFYSSPVLLFFPIICFFSFWKVSGGPASEGRGSGKPQLPIFLRGSHLFTVLGGQGVRKVSSSRKRTKLFWKRIYQFWRWINQLFGRMKRINVRFFAPRALFGLIFCLSCVLFQGEAEF